MVRFTENAFCVVWTALRLLLLKILCGSRFHSGPVERISPNVKLRAAGKLRLGKYCSIHSGTRLFCGRDGELTLGDHVYMGYDVLVVCRKSIRIGSGTEIGPRVLIYDHDHDFRCEGGIHANRYKSSPVTVGENCWIGAGSILLRGVTIGDRAVIGAGSVITKDVPPDTVVIQKRENTQLR